MSLTKRLIEEEERYYGIAKSILVEIGAIRLCACGNVYCDTGEYDNKTMYATATKKLKEKYGNTQDFKLFDKALDSIINQCTYDLVCPLCGEGQED